MIYKKPSSIRREFKRRLLRLVLGKGLGAVNKTPFVVLSAVDEVRVVEGQLDGTVDNVVHGLDTEHE